MYDKCEVILYDVTFNTAFFTKFWLMDRVLTISNFLKISKIVSIRKYQTFTRGSNRLFYLAALPCACSGSHCWWFLRSNSNTNFWFIRIKVFPSRKFSLYKTDVVIFISDEVAGVTLVALGNGAADIFAAIASEWFQKSKNEGSLEDPELVVGSLPPNYNGRSNTRMFFWNH